MITSSSSTLLAEALDQREKEIRSYLHLSQARWDNLTKRIASQEQSQTPGFAGEQVWTFLISCGYALCGEEGIKKLTRLLTSSDKIRQISPRIWFECMPLPPRKREHNTHIDLALGTISPRNRTISGIQLDDFINTWVCFCEMKYYSDISTGTTHDSERNQLLRVIENALSFRSSDSERYADEVSVTLVTPKVFRHADVKSQLYQYKYEEYKNDPTSIISDLDKCSQKPNWHLTEIVKRLNNFSLNWITYEELLANLPYPEETLYPELFLKLGRFWENYGRTKIE